MDRYTVYCTEEQTKKALELGAPIEYYKTNIRKNDLITIETKEVFVFPTAEQMIGWLEEQEDICEVEITTLHDQCGKGWCYCIFDKDRCDVRFNRNYPSRKEATLAAIDAALDYLSKK